MLESEFFKFVVIYTHNFPFDVNNFNNIRYDRRKKKLYTYRSSLSICLRKILGAFFYPHGNFSYFIFLHSVFDESLLNKSQLFLF